MGDGQISAHRSTASGMVSPTSGFESTANLTVPPQETTIYEEDDDENVDHEKIHLINAKQFKMVNQLFEDYYDLHEPKNIKYEAMKELKKRLKKEKVLNVNVVENEFLRIKKENNGQGAVMDESLRCDDQSMQMFRKELSRLLMVP